GAQFAFGSGSIFQVVDKPPAASTAHSSRRPSGSGAAAISCAWPRTDPVSLPKSVHGTHSAFGFVVLFHVENNPVGLSAQNCNLKSLSGATATRVTSGTTLMSACVKGFGCRPDASVRPGIGGPASESLR